MFPHFSDAHSAQTVRVLWTNKVYTSVASILKTRNRFLQVSISNQALRLMRPQGSHRNRRLADARSKKTEIERTSARLQRLKVSRWGPGVSVSKVAFNLWKHQTVMGHELNASLTHVRKYPPSRRWGKVVAHDLRTLSNHTAKLSSIFTCGSGAATTLS